VIDRLSTNAFSNWVASDATCSDLGCAMAEVRYLSKVYPNVSVLDVAAALMKCNDAPEVCDDGLFVPLVLQGNRRLKLPAALFSGDPVRLCEKLLLQFDLKLGISWAHTYAGESGKHALLNKRMQLRASPPAVLEPLFLVFVSARAGAVASDH